MQTATETRANNYNDELVGAMATAREAVQQLDRLGIAVIAIIVEKSESTRELNDVLHEYCEHIIGRMGIPYRSRGVNIISVAVDAPNDIINALSGKIGRIQGVTTKTAYSNVGA